MFRAIVLLLFLAAAVIAALWLAAQPEEVELAVGAWQARMPATVAGLFAAIALGIAGVVALLLRWLLSRPRAFGQWRDARRQERGSEAMERALILLSSGRHGQAMREAERAGRLLDHSTMTLWLTAQAAQAGGDGAKAETALRRLTLKPGAALIGLRGLAAREAEAGNTEAARTLLAEATAADPGAVALKAIEAELAVRAHDWRAALAHARGVPQDAKAKTRRAQLALAVAETERDDEPKLALLKEAFESDPAFAPGVAAYARALEATGSRRRSRNVMREGWRAGPHPAIAAVALTAVGADTPLTILERAHALAADRAEHLESRVMVARAALDAEKWKDARLQLEAAVADGSADRRIHLLRAELFERQGGNADAARAAYREAGEAPNEPVWLCSACGTVHKEWTPVCDACGAALSLVWSVAPRAVPVPAQVGGRAPVPMVAPVAPVAAANLPVVAN
jgi:HemY protein